MSIQFTSITKRSDSTWQFVWNDTGASYYRVILYGVQVGQVTSENYIHQDPGWDEYPPPLEVVEEDELALSEIHRPYFRAQWYATPGATFYQMEEFLPVHNFWRRRNRLAENNLPVYTWTSARLEDETSYVYRIRSGDDIEQMSDGLTFSVFVVTPPRFRETEVAVKYEEALLSVVVEEAAQ